MMRKLTGSCLCKKVVIEIDDDFLFMGNCHCSECRKFTGSDYSSVGAVTADKFRYIRGEEFVSIYKKSDATDLAFCQCCGSSLFSRKHATGNYNVRLGILDDIPTHKPSFHIFTGSKAPWYEIHDDLQQFENGPVK